jgi:hypothetical protein
MLNAFLYEGNSVMDFLLQPRGRELRALAIEGWNKAKPKTPAMYDKDSDMIRALESFMDKLTDAKYVQDALEYRDILADRTRK